MPTIFAIFGGIWGRLAMIVVSVSSLAALLFSIRWRIRKNARQELSNEIQQRTLDRIEDAKDAVNEFRSDGRDIRDKLRDQGYLRD
jgi:uncharacterized protein (DUF58 family)